MDKILQGFLTRQYEDGMALAQASDLLDLIPGEVEGHPPRRYLARFRCRGLVHSDAGGVTEANRFEVGFWFPPDYLRSADPSYVLTWLGPRRVFHPNVRKPFICVGHLTPGTPIVDLLYQVFEIITYQKVTMREDDALNPDACSWVRRNQDRLPIDRRPLKRRT